MHLAQRRLTKNKKDDSIRKTTTTREVDASHHFRVNLQASFVPPIFGRWISDIGDRIFFMKSEIWHLKSDVWKCSLTIK